jgi:hypothetical protein
MALKLGVSEKGNAIEAAHVTSIPHAIDLLHLIETTNIRLHSEYMLREYAYKSRVSVADSSGFFLSAPPSSPQEWLSFPSCLLILSFFALGSRDTFPVNLFVDVCPNQSWVK